MNPTRHSRPVRSVAGVLTGLAALLASITTASAAFASSLRADPPGWLHRFPAPVRLPPLPPGWNKHPPLPSPVHAHAAPAYGMPGWQIVLVAGGVAALAAMLAVIVIRMRGARRRVTATTAPALAVSGVGTIRGADPQDWPDQACRPESTESIPS